MGPRRRTLESQVRERVDAMKKYVVTLNKEERSSLEAVIGKGKGSAHRQRHARILLKVDQGEQGPGWSDEETVAALDVSVRTVERVRQRCVEEGPEAAMQPKAQENRRRKMDGRAEARLVMLACSKAPKGSARWTLHLLADKMVEMQYAPSLSHETVRRTLKKTR